MSRFDLLTVGLLAGLGLIASDAAAEATHHRHGHGHREARTRPKVAAVAAPNQSNLVVRGRRFLPAPVPNLAIHDPAEAVRDPSTGAAIGRFGGAYIDANPVPPVNTGPSGVQSPIDVGIHH